MLTFHCSEAGGRIPSALCERYSPAITAFSARLLDVSHRRGVGMKFLEWV